MQDAYKRHCTARTQLVLAYTWHSAVLLHYWAGRHSLAGRSETPQTGTLNCRAHLDQQAAIIAHHHLCMSTSAVAVGQAASWLTFTSRLSKYGDTTFPAVMAPSKRMPGPPGER